MTREIFNEMFDKYDEIISKYSYRTLYDICWSGRLKTILGDDCKVTYCGYSVINFTNGYFNYTICNYDGKWKLENYIGASVEKDDNHCDVRFYRSKEWDENTDFYYSACYTRYPYKCKDGKFHYTINDVVFIDYFEDNHNACLTAMKYGISIEKAREYVYGK